MNKILRIPPFASISSSPSPSSSSSSNVSGTLPSGVLKYKEDEWRRPNCDGNSGDVMAGLVVDDIFTVVLPITPNAQLHVGHVAAIVYTKRSNLAVAVVMVKFSFCRSSLLFSNWNFALEEIFLTTEMGSWKDPSNSNKLLVILYSPRTNVRELIVGLVMNLNILICDDCEEEV